MFGRLSRWPRDVWFPIFCDFCKPVIIHLVHLLFMFSSWSPDFILWSRRCCERLRCEFYFTKCCLLKWCSSRSSLPLSLVDCFLSCFNGSHGFLYPYLLLWPAFISIGDKSAKFHMNEDVMYNSSSFAERCRSYCLLGFLQLRATISMQFLCLIRALD